MLNNNYLGNVRQWQDLNFHGVHSMTVLTRQGRMPQERIEADPDVPYLPDFLKIADAYGAKSRRVTAPVDVEPALREALSDDEVWILEFMVEPSANIEPMIPPGRTIRDIILRFK